MVLKLGPNFNKFQQFCTYLCIRVPSVSLSRFYLFNAMTLHLINVLFTNRKSGLTCSTQTLPLITEFVHTSTYSQEDSSFTPNDPVKTCTRMFSIALLIFLSSVKHSLECDNLTWQIEICLVAKKIHGTSCIM